MPQEQTIPSEQPRTVVSYTIRSGENEVSQGYHVLSIVINKEVNRIPSASIIIADGDVATETFEVSNQDVFTPGKEIEIQLGHQGTNEKVFKGIVVKHSIKTRKNTSVLIIECRDKVTRMTSAIKGNYFKDMTDGEAIEQVIDNYGFDKDVDATTLKHKQVVQYNCTDWDFMLCRADVNGLLCIADEGKLAVKKPDFKSASVLTVQYGATIYELDAEIDARLQYKTIKGAAWNYTEQQLLDDVEAEEPPMPVAGNLDGTTLAAALEDDTLMLYHSGKIEEPELQQWANAKMMKHRLAKIRGQVTIDGTPIVKPGQIIELKGVGERFQGKLFVTAVRQQYEGGNWLTSLQFGINPEWFVQTYKVEQPLAGAMLPAIEGLQTGVVTKLENDPDGEDRIMVRIPVVHKDDEGAWCRVGAVDAGKERGMYFRPEINDEVIVGFINNDPRHGVVLGMLNSSKLPAPVTAADDNHEKGYVSRSKMKMIFNDDKKSISIETPAGNKMIITEEDKKIHIEDQHSNKIIMNEDGITMESGKNIKIKAGGDIAMEGNNISIEGNAQTKVAGQGGAELSSGAATNIKGSVVNINC